MKLWQKAIVAIPIIYLLDVYLRERLAASKARKIAKKLGKPLLNVGSGRSDQRGYVVVVRVEEGAVVVLD